MRRRPAGGIGTLVAVVAFFVGTPIGLVIAAGWPLPSLEALRTAVQLHYVPAQLLGQLTATGAWLAWGWLVVASARMAFEAWTDRPPGPALGAGWLRPVIVHAVAGILLVTGAATRTPAWAAATKARSAPWSPQLAAAARPGHGSPAPAARRAPAADPDRDVTAGGRYRSQLLSATAGEARTPNPAPAPTPPPSGTHYVVQRGDNLWDIARTHLGDPLRWRQIWQLNHGLPQPDGRTLSDPGRIYPGWQLQLPPVRTGITSPPPTTNSAPPASATASTPGGPITGHDPVTAPTSTTAPTAETRVAPGVSRGTPSVAAGPASAETRSRPPTPSAAPPATDRRHGTRPASRGRDDRQAAPVAALGAAGLSSAALWLGVRRWRRRRMAKMPPGWLPARPSHDIQALAEDAIQAGQDSVDRLDVALRHLGLAMEARPPGQVPVPAAVIMQPDDTVDVILDGDQPGEPPSGWLAAGDRRWRLPADQTLEVRPAERRAPAPCPALVTVGDTNAGAVLVNLEVTGGAFLDGSDPQAKAWCRRWALELSIAPWSAGIRVLVDDRLGLPAGAPRVETVEAAARDARCRAAADWGAAAAGTLGGESHPQARIAGRLGDELAVAVWPDRDAPTSCPGLVVIANRPGGLRIDLAAGRGQVPGVGTVRLARFDDTETDAALAAGVAEAVAPPPTAVPDLTTVEPPRPSPTAQPADQVPIGQSALPGLGAKLRLLGPVQVLNVAQPHRAQLVEMAALLGLRQEGWSWETFCQVIWRDRGDDPESGPAVKTVRTRIAELRSWLGGRHTVISDEGNLRLAPDLDVDWWRFEALAARSDTMRQAISLVNGRPLQGVLEGWAERDYWITCIEAKMIAVALAASDAATRHGDWDQALAAAETGLKLCPFDQRLTRAAMRAAAGTDMGLVHALVARAEAQLEEDEGLDPETIELLHGLSTQSK